MSGLPEFSGEIYKRYGSIRRARGCFLYTEKNVRLTDLYQENGRAILGWGAGSASTHLKNVLNRGITGTYITGFDYRLEKSVSALLGSERDVFVFSDKSRALSEALAISRDSTSVWRPWQCARADEGTAAPPVSSVDCVVFEPPFPWGQNIFLLAVLKSLCVVARPAGIKLPAPLSAAVTRSVYDLISALQARSEKDWFLWDTVLTRYWERRGPYLYPRKDALDEDSYAGFVLHCLDLGIVVSPVYQSPSIVPFGADRGVLACLKKNPFSKITGGSDG